MEEFGIRQVFNSVVQELSKSVGDTNIVRLWMEKTLPEWYVGSAVEVSVPIQIIAGFLASNLNNGIISLEIKEWTKTEDRVSLLVSILGNGTAELGVSARHKSESELVEQFKNLSLKDFNRVSFSAKNSKLIAKVKFELELSDKASKPTNLQNKKVLIVEDNEVNALVFSSFLEDWGINVELAYNGIEGVEMAWVNEYNAIIMDLYMPGLDGFDATKKIREFNETVPIIALSGSVLETDVRRALEVGASEYLSKPISNSALFECLSRHIV
jgi:CheY-like chemotaxis protein